MKNFLKQEIIERFNEIINELGASYIEMKIKPALFFPETETEKLPSDVALSEMICKKSKTFKLKNERFVIYKRDKSIYQGVPESELNKHLPKIHLLRCKTIKEVEAANRIETYVMKLSSDDFSTVNFFDSNSREPKYSLKKRLWPCENCLKELGILDKYKYQKYNFSLKDYFRNPDYINQFKELKIGTEHTSLLNTYHTNFDKISFIQKEINNWECQGCGKKSLKGSHSVHTHHLNGHKRDNCKKNLEVLCYDCHSEQPFHGHMRQSYSSEEVEVTN